jgi:O-antigen/teichoic acid export membrane protein
MAGWALNAVLRLSLLPLFTRYIDSSEYGVLSILDAFVEIIQIVCAVGLSSAIVRYYHDTTDEAEQNATFSTGILMLLVISSLCFILVFLFRLPLTSLVIGSGNDPRYLTLCAATMAFGLIRSGTDSYFISRKESVAFVLVQSVQAILNSCMSVYLVVFREMGVIGMLIGNAVSAALVTGFVLIFVLRRVYLKYRYDIAIKLVKFGAPLAVSLIAAAGIHTLDRFFLRYYTSMSSVGLYSLAYQFPFMLNSILAASFDRIFVGSTMYEIGKSSDAINQYKRICTYYMGLLGFALYSLSVCSKTVVKIFTAPEYANAAVYIPLISLSIWIYGLHTFLKTSVLLKKKTHLFTINHFIALAVNIVFNFVLVPPFGAMGAAFATAITYSSFSLFGLIIYRKVYPLEFEWERLGIMLLLGLSLCCLRSFVYHPNFFYTLLVDITFVLGYPMVLFCLPNFLSLEERKGIKNFLSGPICRIISLSKG